MRTILMVSTALFVTSCATMTPKECKNADWSAQGFEDSSEGRTVELADDAKACAKVHVVPNKKLYMEGYNKGAKVFCTYDNGVKTGEENNSVSDVCKTTGLDKDFERGYKKGQKMYAKKQAIEKKKKEISEMDKKIKAITSGKEKGNVKNIDLLYREKELAEKEVTLLNKELKNIK